MSNVTPIRPGMEPPKTEREIPSRETLEKRLQDALQRVGRVQNVIGTVSKLLDLEDEGGQQYDVWGTLQVANELLTNLYESLEVPVLLKTE